MRSARFLSIRGMVQGVGFRPHVHALATRLGLDGVVRNAGGRVEVELEGEAAALEAFQRELLAAPSVHASISELVSRAAPLTHVRGFRIESSANDAGADVLISPDIGLCPECLAELQDPRNRRHRHPFITCTNCGPRLTIQCAAPYDRERTTMAPFAMCDECRRECGQPGNRRFHSQTNACPNCGPRLTLHDVRGLAVECENPLEEFANAIVAGAIGAVKGIGGFHLTCDASNSRAVEELRCRKQREERPLAIMVLNLEAARALCHVDEAEAALLESWRRPIVLLRSRAAEGASPGVASSVAGGSPDLGVMLPYAPLHGLLLREVHARPLVMTSGNRSGEPIVRENEEAFERLRGIADLFLMHDREIQLRCDDSVVRIISGEEAPVRRSRGYAPEPIPLPFELPAPILAVGGQSRVTFALGRGREAILSPHQGDLDELRACREFERDIVRCSEMFRMQPQCVVHDLHPDYASTRLALRWSDEGADFAPGGKLQRIAVQHHHAHLASCMAEHRLDGELIGVTFDGTGLGTDGAVWGGEFLVGGYRSFRRAAHLRYVGLAGGEAAVREPWRMAVAHLLDAGLPTDLLAERIPVQKLETVAAMLERRVNSPPTSSMGRLFDAVASLLGVCDRSTFEGQAAMKLEWLAREAPSQSAYPWPVGKAPGVQSPVSSVSVGPPASASMVIDTRPLIRAVADDVHRGVEPSIIARRFHATIAGMIADVCASIRDASGLNRVALSGGVFLNALLTDEAIRLLESRGFETWRQTQVPCNDGGLSLGQLAIAGATLAARQAEGRSEAIRGGSR